MGDAVSVRSGGKLYVRVAERLTADIRNGTYAPGARLPSVRGLARRLKLSVSTVVAAYGRLLDAGLIESHPQSGFFVRHLARPPALPGISRPRAIPTVVSSGDIAMEVVHATADQDAVAFGSALPADDLPALRKMERCLAAQARTLGPRALVYEVPPGLRALRVQIARRGVDAGCSFSPDDVVVTNGCQEALVLALRALTAAGDTVAVESPTFYGILQAVRSLGLRVLEIPTHPESGISLDALEMALSEWPVKACVLTPAASNPLGYVMPDSNKAALIGLLEDHGVPLIEDDIYGELVYGSARPRALKSWDRTGNVLLCSSVSKSIAPGLRVGWVVPGRHFDAVNHLKLVSSMASATLPQAAVAAYLAEGGYDRHLTTARALYRERRDRLLDLVPSLFPPNTRVTRPAGGFVAWLELPKAVDAVVLYRRALDQRISLAPGTLFSAREKYRHFIRLNFARPWDEPRVRALAAIGRLARD